MMLKNIIREVATNLLVPTLHHWWLPELWPPPLCNSSPCWCCNKQFKSQSYFTRCSINKYSGTSLPKLNC